MEGTTDETRRLGRRQFLIGAAATGLLAAGNVNAGALARSARRPIASEGTFEQGVSSGIPGPRGITLWTRLSGLDRTSKVTLEIARDRGFRRLVERRYVLADARRDYTVHARVDGLQPGQQYYYRFETKRKTSQIGRFRTLPPTDSRQPVRIGFFSCQNYEAGYFNAHGALAREKDLDLVVCLGDYIYERHFYDGPENRVDRTGVNGDGDVQTLAEYRQKYRLYQSDPDLQALHAAYPFVAIWDDHEIEDNYNRDGNSPNQPDPAFDNVMTPRRVGFNERKMNGYRAFFEAMPRLMVKGAPNRVHRSFRLGRTAELFLTDQRRFRDPQPCGDKLLPVGCKEFEEPGRTMLGKDQKQWFKQSVVKSSARWKLWGSQVMAMALDLPAGNHANPDQWDGYAAERSEILRHFRARGVENLAVLSGDIHTFFAGNLSTTGDSSGDPVGVEFGGGSMTSLGIPDAVNISPEALESLIPNSDPHIQWADFAHRGYGVATARTNELVCDLRGVPSTLVRSPDVSTLASFRVAAGRPEIERLR